MSKRSNTDAVVDLTQQVPNSMRARQRQQQQQQQRSSSSISSSRNSVQSGSASASAAGYGGHAASSSSSSSSGMGRRKHQSGRSVSSSSSSSDVIDLDDILSATFPEHLEPPKKRVRAESPPHSSSCGATTQALRSVVAAPSSSAGAAAGASPIRVGRVGGGDSSSIVSKKASPGFRIPQPDDDDGSWLTCVVCKKPHESYQTAHLLETCGHCCCRECGTRTLMAWVANPSSPRCQCPKCCSDFDHGDVQALLSREQLDSYETKLLHLSFGADLVTCPNPDCRAMFERVETTSSQGDIPIEDGETEEAAYHRANFRFRCRSCTQEFCAQCNRTPYHNHYTCETFQTFKESEKCRFCESALEASLIKKTGPVTLRNVCASDECSAKAKLSCTKSLGCGHACAGVRGETNDQHPNCLECPDAGGDQPGGEFCNICYVEELRAGPVVQLECGHVFHFECAEKKVTSGWVTPHISFSFMECPLCRVWMVHWKLQHHPDYKQAEGLKREIETKAAERAKLMDLANAKEIKDPSSKWHGKMLDYAIAKYSYYQCKKCKHSYFGGERACGDGADAFQALEAQAARDAGAVNRDDLICGKCSDNRRDAKCATHGTEYIEYKCRFCCNVAVWFCWGTTHFCNPCHQKAATVAALPPSKLPKCTCEVVHPPNGTEFLLGCSLCRLEKAQRV